MRFISSAGLAVGLLVFVGTWSMLATVVAQGEAGSTGVEAWAAANPVFEPAVRFLGLHQAFTSYAFLAAVCLLGISTAVCAWRRTKVALVRSRALRAAHAIGWDALAESHDIEVACSPGMSTSEALANAENALGSLGIRTQRRDEVLVAVSPSWTVWGSTVFHWSLVALIVVVLTGQMLRSEGSMALAVGETKTDEPAAYVSLTEGSWHQLIRADRSIRVDDFDPSYQTGGIDRGAVPTVSVLDGTGKVIASQRVYPNSMLHSGSLAINAPACGLAVRLALLDAAGVEGSRITQYVDFAQTADQGTVAVRGVTRSDASGKVVMRMWATVPLERTDHGFGEWIPKQPSARIRVADGDDKILLDDTMKLGERIPLPGGGSVRFLQIGWYSRLSLVDDPTIPLVYAAMIIAMLGLTMTLVFRQQIIVATVLDRPSGAVLAMRARLWRNTSTNRDEIVSELTRALQGSEKEGMS